MTSGNVNSRGVFQVSPGSSNDDLERGERCSSPPTRSASDTARNFASDIPLSRTAASQTSGKKIVAADKWADGKKSDQHFKTVDLLRPKTDWREPPAVLTALIAFSKLDFGVVS